jgi:UDP-N-acetylglucosamine 4,6-dehydratase
VKLDLIGRHEPLIAFKGRVTNMKEELLWDKQALVDLFYYTIPDFGHPETGKNLDSKM